MAISDAQYLEWLGDRMAKPVHLAVITHKSGAISRLSSRYYRPADSMAAGQVWRSRLGDVDIAWGIDGGVGGYSELSVSGLRIINADYAFDGWRDDPVTDVDVKLGDVDWDTTDFRSLISGKPSQVKLGKICTVELKGNEAKADTIKNLSLTAAKPGTMLQTLLTTYGGFVVGDIDTVAMIQLDTDYPYNIAAISGDFNVLAAADKILGGLPVDWGAGFDGKVTIFELKAPAGTSTYRDIKPVKVNEPTHDEPVWRVTFSGDFGADETTERAATQTSWPSAREINLKTHLSLTADRTTLANKLLDLYNTPRDKLKLSTDRRDRFSVGDEVKQVFTGLGYDNGRYGVITAITRGAVQQQLEVRV